MKKFTSDDEKFMLMAIDEAKKAFEMDEVPIGAVIVKNNEILAKAHNLTETLKIVTGHAEILAIQKASNSICDFRLTGANLYVTVEPCYMCSGAAILSRIQRIIWGCPDPRHGANVSLVNIFNQRHPIHQVEIIGGLFGDEARKLMQTFFQNKREENREKRRLARINVRACS